MVISTYILGTYFSSNSKIWWDCVFSSYYKINVLFFRYDLRNKYIKTGISFLTWEAITLIISNQRIVQHINMPLEYWWFSNPKISLRWFGYLVESVELV